MKAKDLTGQRFGMLTALGRAQSINGRTTWLCKCDCGNFKIAQTDLLVRGATKSCGCLIKRYKDFRAEDLTGRRFGRLVAVEEVERDYMNRVVSNALWRCRCDCGQEIITLAGSLKAGKTRSCGCLRDPEVRAAFLAEQGEGNASTKVWDITGQRFGRLTVVERAGKNHNGKLWLCRCDCGNMTAVPAKYLFSGNTKSCGCMRGGQRKDLTGKRFGRLVVIGKYEGDYHGDKRSLWRCQCDCGQETVVKSNNLKSGQTKSCGCLRDPKIRAEFSTQQAN